jgi:glucose dehydrogenase
MSFLSYNSRLTDLGYALCFACLYMLLWAMSILQFGWWDLRNMLLIQFLGTLIIAYAMLRIGNAFAANAAGIIVCLIIVIIAASNISPLIQFPAQQYIETYTIVISDIHISAQTS